jgi:hypothetical protein
MKRRKDKILIFSFIHPLMSVAGDSISEVSDMELDT